MTASQDFTQKLYDAAAANAEGDAGAGTGPADGGDDDVIDAEIVDE